VSFHVSTANFFLLHCDEWDHVVALPRHKFVTGASLLQLRNLVNKIKRKSIREYFIERCVGGPKQKDFWPTIKPFITNKGSYF
jgi:hypothetical protein